MLPYLLGLQGSVGGRDADGCRGPVGDETAKLSTVGLSIDSEKSQSSIGYRNPVECSPRVPSWEEGEGRSCRREWPVSRRLRRWTLGMVLVRTVQIVPSVSTYGSWYDWYRLWHAEMVPASCGTGTNRLPLVPNHGMALTDGAAEVGADVDGVGGVAVRLGRALRPRSLRVALDRE